MLVVFCKLIQPAVICCADASKCACGNYKSEEAPNGFGAAALPGPGPAGPFGPELELEPCSSEGRLKSFVALPSVLLCECMNSFVGGVGGCGGGWLCVCVLV